MRYFIALILAWFAFYLMIAMLGVITMMDVSYFNMANWIIEARAIYATLFCGSIAIVCVAYFEYRSLK